ncbi:MAG: EAL domain-containing protein, partial [Alphaproteobacteria bacterium]
LRAQAVTSRQSKQLRCAGLMRDITSQKRSQESLLHNAIYDSLTGLPNRELFLDRIQCAIASVQDENSKPTILYLDIDTFKTLNRTADITVSDSMLLSVSRRLARHLGAQDTLARIGAEQFGVLISAETEPRHIALLAERVRRSLRAPMKIGGQDIVLSGSIGIAVFDGQQSTPADLLREAETAMFRAKRSGADRIELYKPEMRREPDDREALETGLRQAIEKRQIRVLYQPVMRLGDDELAGFEAHMRWEHPKLGSLAAAEFMPVAEDTGLISELSTYVMERVARQVTRWHRALPREEDPLFVAMNISSRHLFKQELVQELRLILGRESVPKGCLRLEVTESLIMENPEQAIEVLDLLKSLGAGLSLDEFGAGYSSLAYLHRLAVDTIKIDRLLVAHGNDNKSGAVVLRAALAMARELGKDVVAVGIEREDDVAYMRALGCDYAQGLYFGEAMNEREAMQLINAIAKSGKREKKKKKPIEAGSGSGSGAGTGAGADTMGADDLPEMPAQHQMPAQHHPQQHAMSPSARPQMHGPSAPQQHAPHQLAPQQPDPHYAPQPHMAHAAYTPPRAPHGPQAGSPDMGGRQSLPIPASPPPQAAKPAPKKKSNFFSTMMDNVGLTDLFNRPKQAPGRRKPRSAPPSQSQQKAGQRDPREAREQREPRPPREARDPREQREARDPREQREAREPRDRRERDQRNPQQQPPSHGSVERPSEKPNDGASSSLRGKLTQLDPSGGAASNETKSDAGGSSRTHLQVQVTSQPSTNDASPYGAQKPQPQDDGAPGA